MRRCHTLLLTVAIATLAAACGRQKSYTLSDFQAVYQPTYATGFEILGRAGLKSTVLHVCNPWQKAEGVDFYVFLARNGEQAPQGFEGQVVQVPVRNVAALSSSYVAMFDAVGKTDCIRSVSGLQYITNRVVRCRAAAGEVAEAGYDSNLNYEILKGAHTDAVLMYGLMSEQTGTNAKLRELGIPYIYIGDYVEAKPLGKAEWTVAVAELCDCRTRGKQVFDRIAERYNRLCDSVRKRYGTQPRPQVMLNTPYRDAWFMPSSNSYMVQLLQDAGAQYVYDNPTANASTTVSLEEALAVCSNADFWLNTGSSNTLAELRAAVPKFAAVRAVRREQVYNNTPAQANVGSDFWESGAVRADAVLQDLIRIFHDAPSDEQLTYYHRLR